MRWLRIEANAGKRMRAARPDAERMPRPRIESNSITKQFDPSMWTPIYERDLNEQTRTAFQIGLRFRADRRALRVRSLCDILDMRS